MLVVAVFVAVVVDVDVVAFDDYVLIFVVTFLATSPATLFTFF